MSIDRDRLLRTLVVLPFEEGRCVVTGSAPMLMLGVNDSISDVDIVADAESWQVAVSVSTGEPRVGLFGDRVVSLRVNDVEVEVFDGWLGIDAQTMLDEANDIDGHLFSPLDRVAESKRTLARPKDLRHLELIERRLGEEPAANGRAPGTD